jgi:hypothetical protein
VAKKSLLAQSETTETAIALPNDIGGLAGLQDQGSSYESVPYVAFIHPLMKTYSRVQRDLPDADVGTPVVIPPKDTDKVIALTPFRFLLLRSWHYFAKTDQQGNIVEAIEGKDDARKQKGFGDYIETVVLAVLSDNSLLPARCTFKTTKASAYFKAKDAVLAASNDSEWASRSEAHRQTLALKQPNLRVVHSVKLTSLTFKTGFSGHLATSTSAPLSSELAKVLAESVTDADWLNKLQLVNEAFDRRKGSVTSEFFNV